MCLALKVIKGAAEYCLRGRAQVTAGVTVQGDLGRTCGSRASRHFIPSL